MADLPEIRIGTTEREQAMAALSDHFSAGRLQFDEFEERSGLIGVATTRGELERVFEDLPATTHSATLAPRGPEQATTGEVAPSRGRDWDWRASVMAIMPFLALGLFFVTDFDNRWLFFLLVPASGALLYGGRNRS